jgi:hypothetical protein
MRLFSRLTMICAATALVVPSVARAGDPPVGVHAFAAIDFNQFAASNTFRAIFNSATIPGYGGGADITGLWRQLFLRVAFTRLTKDGTRVFVDNSQVFKLNEPAKLSMTPIELGGGWRFATGSRFTPYAGGGALITKYRVTYTLSPDLNESQSFNGGVVFGGVDVGITKILTVGGEAQYRALPNALKSDLTSSAANAFGEKNLGGLTGRITFGVRFGK